MVRSEIKMIIQKTISYCLTTDSHIVANRTQNDVNCQWTGFLFLHNYLKFGI